MIADIFSPGIYLKQEVLFTNSEEDKLWNATTKDGSFERGGGQAKKLASNYNFVCRDISQLSSVDEERLHGSLDST